MIVEIKIEPNKWINKKNNKTYYVINDNIINATNKSNGEEMVLYCNDANMFFVREKKEFLEKFKKVMEE